MPDERVITPEDVLQFTGPTDGYLCPLEANVHGVEFLAFSIKDYDSNKTVYQSGQDQTAEPVIPSTQAEYEELVRSVRYTFPAEFLTYRTIRTALEFKVGGNPLDKFRMIELHYFKNNVVRVYDFEFGFCIPNSVNTWEAIYDVPEYSAAERQEYVDCPFAHKSDSFYFVDNQLMMHNKAEYRYVP